MSSRARIEDENLAEEERLIGKRARLLENSEKSWLRKCLLLLRPFEIIFGVVFFLMAVLVFVSLLLTK